jgi:acyl-CoA reductase-like NAD-dependent aldehyde dehydrogenase
LERAVAATYNLFVGGTWRRASRNAVTDDFNPATGALYARVQQAGAAETTEAITLAAAAQKCCSPCRANSGSRSASRSA